MNSEDISRELHRSKLVPNMKTARSVVAAVFDTITHAVVDGHRVQVKNFGAFYSAQYAERKGRNQLTGEDITIPARKRLRLKASKTISRQLNSDD